MPPTVETPASDTNPKTPEDKIRDALSKFEELSAKLQQQGLEIQRRSFNWTRGVVVVTAVYTFFAALQWWTMRSQLAEMHGTSVQTDKLITAANAISDHQKQMVADNKTNLAQNKAAIENTLKENREELAKLLGENQNVLKTNLAQGRAALDASINASRLDQRAWLGVDNIKGELVVGSPYKADVSIRNTGKTPALHVHADFKLEVTRPTEKPSFKYDDIVVGVLDSRGVIAPTVPYHLSTFPIQDKAHRPLAMTQSYIDEIANGSALVWVHGRVEYKDVFRHPHWLTFCYLLSPQFKTFDVCNEHNDTDETQLKYR
ncbi:MAG TPA: hypothetical protein VK648_12400 [Gemmatimonadaceae bacterium]|nr:hypothetical protein [Gemmatimonadaceae bacterium]